MNNFEPSFLSIIPPLLAIILAFIIKDVFISLFIGVFVGTIFLKHFNIFEAFYSVFNDRFVNVLIDDSHIKILMFTLGMAGFIGILRQSGALVDLIDRVKNKISTPKHGMFATWLSGLLIFFDDYANAFLVGNTLRPLTDKLKISREKLSYIVDSTSAPVASLALSTWIGTEISILQDSYSLIDPSISGMSLFISSIPFRFYSIFTIFFVLFICVLDRDYGAMAKAEHRARTTGALNGPKAVPMQDDKIDRFTKKIKNGKWFQAAFPLLAMILFISIFMYYSGANTIGFDKPLKDILGAASTTSSLMFGPVVGIIIFYILGFKLMSIHETVESFISGTKLVLIAVFILTLAWSMGAICKDIGTANYIITILGDKIPPYFIPSIAFILSAIIAFATGSSWGTMAIIIPILIPLTNHILISNGIETETFNNIMFGTIGSCLAGSCWGDHSSPISDTTLFSAMSSSADLMDHVKTQMPYALTVAGLSIFIGYIPIAFGINVYILIPIGILACFLIIRFYGRKNVNVLK